MQVSLNADEIISSESLAQGWQAVLGGVFSSPELQKLKAFLAREWSSSAVVYPSREDIFRALRLVDYSNVRVVILGQDPYHGADQANGLAFAVHRGIKLPPSLKNIFKEIASDLCTQIPHGSTLEGWAAQGVLLLNTVLTVRAGEAFSHRGQGWEVFTEEVVSALNQRSEPVVFILWGAPAHKKEALITNPRHFVLKAAHPSPLSAHRGFFGCAHFSKTNKFLSAQGLTPVDWLMTDTSASL
ncbi:MAG: hypothetical protein RL189_1568 [Pseudomonadota bacterium]|jgi:uracil-DNA glycosylase